MVLNSYSQKNERISQSKKDRLLEILNMKTSDQ